MPGLDVLAFAGLLTLAADPISCTVPRAPVVTILPTTDPVRYDNANSIEALSHMKTNTISPYGKHVEQLMFGLHSGQIRISAKTRLGTQVYGDGPGALGCMYYDSIEIRINLSPVIYIVKEFPPGSCAYEAVAEHEKKHARVDRWIANKYAKRIGAAVQDAVNEAGALGPWPKSDMKTVQNRMIGYVRSTVESLELLMTEEQARLQQKVDSMAEYENVSSVLHKTCKINTNSLAPKNPSQKSR